MAQNVVINGVTYSNVPEVDIPTSGGGVAKFIDTSDANLSSGNSMLSGITAYASGIKITGSIASKTASDLTASGAVVTAPAGYYAAASSKSVAIGSASTPDTVIIADPTMSINSSTGVITAIVHKTQSISPTVTQGYVSSGIAGTITVDGGDLFALSVQSAATYTPTTTDQTISAGVYLTGAQTISGDTNLTANNIRSGVSIFGVNGSLTAATVTQDGTTKILSIS